MDEILEEYSQFIVMGLVFLIAAAYFVYTYYLKQEEIKNINNNIDDKDIDDKDIDDKDDKGMDTELPDFFPTDTFKGYNQGYIFKKDIKGIGYYMDK